MPRQPVRVLISGASVAGPMAAYWLCRQHPVRFGGAEPPGGHRPGGRILMSRTGVTADEANTRLRELGQREHTKLAVLADGIVQAAMNRARSRRSDP